MSSAVYSGSSSARRELCLTEGAQGDRAASEKPQTAQLFGGGGNIRAGAAQLPRGLVQGRRAVRQQIEIQKGHVAVVSGDELVGVLAEICGFRQLFP
jgi:hypothetical protein